MTSRPPTTPAPRGEHGLAVVVAGGSTLVRSALRSSLRASAGDSATISHVGTAEELLRACNQGSQVVALCALDIDGVPLLAVMSQLLSASARVVIVGSQESASLVPELLLRGAAGFLPLETTDPRQLWEAVEAAASGGATLHPAVAMLVLEQWRATRSDEAPQLTAKEMEVLRAMMAGTPAKSIARDLGLSVKTIDTHRSKIFSKLGVRTGAQAVQRALELGLS